MFKIVFLASLADLLILFSPSGGVAILPLHRLLNIFPIFWDVWAAVWCPEDAFFVFFTLDIFFLWSYVIIRIAFFTVSFRCILRLRFFLLIYLYFWFLGIIKEIFVDFVQLYNLDFSEYFLLRLFVFLINKFMFREVVRIKVFMELTILRVFVLLYPIGIRPPL